MTNQRFDMSHQDAARISRLVPDTRLRELKTEIIWSHVSIAGHDMFNSVCHSHSFFEMYCVLAGSVTVELANVSRNFLRGECLLIPPDTQHRLVRYDDAFIRYDLGFRIVGNMPLEKTLIDECRNGKSFALTENILNMITYMKYAVSGECPFPECGSGAVVTALLIDAVGQLVPDSGRRVRADSALSQGNIAYAAREYIRDNCARPITPDDAAAVIHLSTRQLARVLKKYDNISFSELLLMARLEKAEALLKSTCLSITEIAARCGFSNEYTFIRAFKRSIGVTPGKYRSNN
ncbi:MAG TPA: helix-turn-helix domain-containing protein [Bacillota bacterium]|nr:helix-turn-helix domain-containing protein [Bacillota bacterium]